MTLRHIDGFDHYATAQLALKYTTLVGSPTVVTTNPRTGPQHLSLGGAGTSITKQLSPHATWFQGFGFRATALTAFIIAAFKDAGTVQVDLRLTGTGALQVTRNATILGTSAPGLITINTQYFIEFGATIHDTTGTYEVRLNNTNVLSGTGADTKNTANATADQALLQGVATMSFDDWYVFDGAGSVCNNFAGDVKVEALLPTAAGNYTEWTPSAGSNYQNVDEASPNSDTDYNSSGTINQRDTYTLGNLATTSGTVLGIQVNRYARKDDAGSRSDAAMIRSGATDAVGATNALADTYTYYSTIWETDPADSSAFTIADVNALEAGSKVIT